MDESIFSRYASRQMNSFFTPEFKYTTWRKLWVSLARAEKELGLPISDEQISELESQIQNIDFEKVHFYEKKLCHDVMAHIHAFGDVAPHARGIIHLGATSCYVTDNTDLIQMREGLCLIQAKLVEIIRILEKEAEKYQNLACLSYTHLQPAQPTTLGKRICLWIQDLLMDLNEISQVIEEMQFLGVKGATGTQASFLSLFHGDQSKVKKLEEKIAQDLNFSKIIPISGQTYTRKQDVRIFNALSSLAISSHKIGTDLRLLSHLDEIEESFGADQVGSSAMPHKRNPIRSERLCSLARLVMSLAQNSGYTAATQWLERSLDDSANRRICIPQIFLLSDALTNLLHHLFSQWIVYPKIIEKNLEKQIPFLSTESILMAAVAKGADRQNLHELLRQKSQEVATAWKTKGEQKNLLQEISRDPSFNLSLNELETIIEHSFYTGRASEQIKDFLTNQVHPLLNKFKSYKADFDKLKI